MTVSREVFLKDWALMLKVENDAFAIAREVINQKKNFVTAVAVLFGLSFRTHKQYILDCAKYWEANFVPGAIVDTDYLLAFQKHYTEEVQPYPADA